MPDSIKQLAEHKLIILHLVQKMGIALSNSESARCRRLSDGAARYPAADGQCMPQPWKCTFLWTAAYMRRNGKAPGTARPAKFFDAFFAIL